MEYTWDPNKAESNYKKHKVHFADSIAVFSDDYALTIEDDCEIEQRFVTIGTDFLGRILVVIYTWRKDDIRIISARKATRKEKEEYKVKS